MTERKPRNLAWRGLVAALLATVAAGLIAMACGDDAAPTATPTATPDPLAVFSGVAGVVDPSNFGWPRLVEGMNGETSIEALPARVLTTSLGHDEMLFALVSKDRIASTTAPTQMADYSNIAAEAEGMPTITADPEVILAQSPDLVIAGPFTSPELVDALERVGVPVLQTELHNEPEGRLADVLLMGYALGAEDRALELVAEIRARDDALRSVTGAKPDSERPRVLALAEWAGTIYTAGAGATEDSVIEAAGGINAAAEAGLEHNPVTNLEGIITMAPDVIVVTQTEETGQPFIDSLKENEAMSGVPAIRDGRVYLGEPKLYTTLSFWNVRGAEELASLLWPEDFAEAEFGPFSFPE